jgi:hypothetical protein
MSEILFLTNTKKKLDLVRPFDRNLSHSSLPVTRERERERVKSQRSALLESFETKKSDAKLYIYVIYI